MANKGPNKVRVRAGDVPNISSGINSSSNKLAIRGETAVFGLIGHGEFSQDYSGVRVLNCDDISIAQSKLCMVWRESNVGAIVCRWDLVTIGIPVPDFIP